MNLKEARATGDFDTLMKIAGNPTVLSAAEIEGFVRREVPLINYFSGVFAHDADEAEVSVVDVAGNSINFIKELLANPNASSEVFEYVFMNCNFEPLSAFAAKQLFGE